MNDEFEDELGVHRLMEEGLVEILKGNWFGFEHDCDILAVKTLSLDKSLFDAGNWQFDLSDRWVSVHQSPEKSVFFIGLPEVWEDVF